MTYAPHYRYPYIRRFRWYNAHPTSVEPLDQRFLTYFASWTPKSQKTFTDPKVSIGTTGRNLNPCKRETNFLQHFTFVILADHQHPPHIPSVKILCLSRSTWTSGCSRDPRLRTFGLGCRQIIPNSF